MVSARTVIVTAIYLNDFALLSRAHWLTPNAEKIASDSLLDTDLLFGKFGAHRKAA